MEEIWKDIEGYDGYYQISNLGRVKNTVKNIIRVLNCNQDGYLCVTLKKKGKSRRFLVHKLVALAFIPKYNETQAITHKDNDRKNNCINNLKLSTFSKCKSKGAKKAGKIGHNVIYNGKQFESKKQFYNKTKKCNLKIEYCSFIDRLSNGWTLEEAIKIPKKIINGGHKEMILYKYKGKKYRISDLYCIYKPNINKSTFKNRLRNGWSVAESLEVPVGVRRDKI